VAPGQPWSAVDDEDTEGETAATVEEEVDDDTCSCKASRSFRMAFDCRSAWLYSVFILTRSSTTFCPLDLVDVYEFRCEPVRPLIYVESRNRPGHKLHSNRIEHLTSEACLCKKRFYERES
jgi:hypothetical protein